ncbi:MAG: hypothetical protein HDT21_07020 [Ruminococcus sp.]|nr:hypothetical protein [Ruminococcus sp.]
MSRSKVIEIDEKKIELFFSTWALMHISERVGGDINTIGTWLDDGKDTAGMLERFSYILADLANGAVIKHNADIALGLEQGDKKPLFPDDYFINILNVSDILTYRAEIFGALNLGSDYEIPDGVELTEKDPDLAEIEREKKEAGRAAT